MTTGKKGLDLIKKYEGFFAKICLVKKKHIING